MSLLRRQDWYLEGWQRKVVTGENGKKSAVWKYSGEYFHYDLSPKGLMRLKTAYVLLTILILVVWVRVSMIRVVGREFFYVGAQWFLCILPFMELVLGVCCFLPVKEKMTYRAMYGSYKRCTYGSRILLVLLFLTVVGEIIFLALYRSKVDLRQEILWLLGVLWCFLCDLIIVILLHKYPPLLE